MNRKLAPLMLSAIGLLPMQVAAQTPAAKRPVPDLEPAKQEFLQLLNELTGNKYDIAVEDSPCLRCGGTAYSVSAPGGLQNVTYRLIYTAEDAQDPSAVVAEKDDHAPADGHITLNEIPAIYGGQIDNAPVAIFRQDEGYVITRISPDLKPDPNPIGLYPNLKVALQKTNPEKAFSRKPPVLPADEPDQKMLFRDYLVQHVPGFERFEPQQSDTVPSGRPTRELYIYYRLEGNQYIHERFAASGVDMAPAGLSLDEVQSFEYHRGNGSSTRIHTVTPNLGAANYFGWNQYHITDKYTDAPTFNTAFKQLYPLH